MVNVSDVLNIWHINVAVDLEGQGQGIKFSIRAYSLPVQSLSQLVIKLKIQALVPPPWK